MVKNVIIPKTTTITNPIIVEKAKLILSNFDILSLNLHSYIIPAQKGANVRMKNRNVAE